jgi:hypothetical protein
VGAGAASAATPLKSAKSNAPQNADFMVVSLLAFV